MTWLKLVTVLPVAVSALLVASPTHADRYSLQTSRSGFAYFSDYRGDIGYFANADGGVEQDLAGEPEPTTSDNVYVCAEVWSDAHSLFDSGCGEGTVNVDPALLMGTITAVIESEVKNLDTHEVVGTSTITVDLFTLGTGLYADWGGPWVRPGPNPSFDAGIDFWLIHWGLLSAQSRVTSASIESPAPGSPAIAGLSEGTHGLLSVSA